jgi:hypothetical protein
MLSSEEDDLQDINEQLHKRLSQAKFDDQIKVNVPSPVALAWDGCSMTHLALAWDACSMTHLETHFPMPNALEMNTAQR